VVAARGGTKLVAAIASATTGQPVRARRVAHLPHAALTDTLTGVHGALHANPGPSQSVGLSPGLARVHATSLADMHAVFSPAPVRRQP
jgi:hypothetical protein